MCVCVCACTDCQGHHITHAPIPHPQERVERRERNREHAKRSRIRKRVILDLLQDQLAALRTENVKLRRVVLERLPEKVSVQTFLLTGSKKT